MQKWIKALTVLLVAQLVIVMLVNAPRLTGHTQDASKKLLEALPKTAKKIIVEAQGETPVTLVLKNDQWHLPEYFDVAADQSKVADLLEKLASFERSWPVATTKQAQERFEVADDKYQRRIAFFSNETDDTQSNALYLGTSPSYRKTHARLNDEDNIYSVSFSNYEAGTSFESWFDQSLLKFDPEDIKAIQTSDISFSLVKEQWQVDALAESEMSQAEPIKDYLAQLSNLRVDKVLGDSTDKGDESSNSTKTISLTRLNDETITLKLTLLDSATGYKLESSLSPLLFELNKAQGDALVELDRATFVTEKPSDAQDSTSSDNTAIDQAGAEPQEEEAQTQIGEETETETEQ